MKHLGAAIICLVVLFAVDAFFFDGWYFGVAAQIVENAYSLDW